MPESAKLTYAGKEYTLPVLTGTEDERGIDVSKLRSESGMITLDEFTDRTDTALAAVTRADLNAVLLDLPGMVNNELANARTELKNTMGTTTRKGHWVVPRELVIRNTLGTTNLDFTQAEVPPLVNVDLFAQTLRGMQKSLILGLLAAVIATGLAAVVGASAGYFGGWVDRALMWVVDLLLVLPAFLILALISPSLRGKSWIFFVFLLALFQWMITGRIVRGMTLSLKEREYVNSTNCPWPATPITPWARRPARVTMPSVATMWAMRCSSRR